MNRSFNTQDILRWCCDNLSGDIWFDLDNDEQSLYPRSYVEENLNLGIPITGLFVMYGDSADDLVLITLYTDKGISNITKL